MVIVPLMPAVVATGAVVAPEEHAAARIATAVSELNLIRVFICFVPLPHPGVQVARPGVFRPRGDRLRSGPSKDV
jgi:hypothetical protein